MRNAGVPEGLGVDGSANNYAGNLIAEARQATLSQRVARGADAMSAQEALEIATRGSAALLLSGPKSVRDLFVEGRQVVRDAQMMFIDVSKLAARQNNLVRRLADAD